MLIEFAVSNFRSFKDKQVFSLLPLGKLRERTIVPVQTENYAKLQVLPTSVLYGANNAGKSNFLRSIQALGWFVTKSGNFNSDKKLIANEFFEFDIQTRHQPTTFEIDFIAPNERRYSFKITFNETQISEETLCVYNTSKTGKVTKNTLYERAGKEIKFVALKGVRESVRFESNQLFLSRGDIEGNPELKEVYSFFSKHLFVYQFTETEYTHFLTKQYAEFAAKNQSHKIAQLIDTILQAVDTGILGIETNLVDVSKISFPENMSQELKDNLLENFKYEMKTRHKLFDGTKEMETTTTSSLSKESTGTRKLLGLLTLVLSALETGDTILIDEMNLSLHTEITTWIIDLFNRPETNPNKAQLILTTHDILLINKDLFDRDQIFIVEKNKYGTSELSFFADITGLRGNHRLSDYYETGRLGGVPHIAKSFLQNTISQYLTDVKKERG
jgi:AAA15 family ATPase/GTPase